MAAYLWVALGGALGSVGRFWMNGLVARQFGENFPWGTMFVNVSGSFIIGLFATLTSSEGRWMVPAWFRLEFVMLGLCGGYTTFSSFSLQTLNLWQAGEWFRAGQNAVLSVCCCLGAVWLGHAIGSWVNQVPK